MVELHTHIFNRLRHQLNENITHSSDDAGRSCCNCHVRWWRERSLSAYCASTRLIRSSEPCVLGLQTRHQPSKTPEAIMTERCLTQQEHRRTREPADPACSSEFLQLGFENASPSCSWTRYKVCFSTRSCQQQSSPIRSNIFVTSKTVRSSKRHQPSLPIRSEPST